MHTTLWVFGYGSLIWDPGFPVADRRIARLDGWHRSFCMRSIHHRGTVESPGLVLALDRAEGATCTGVAFRVTPGHEAATLSALRERELVSSAYLELTLPVVTDVGPLDALAYVIDPDHPHYRTQKEYAPQHGRNAPEIALRTAKAPRSQRKGRERNG
ncbi:MAG: gamma-glutamylcyclotransferase [Tabrizicola sp.]